LGFRDFGVRGAGDPSPRWRERGDFGMTPLFSDAQYFLVSFGAGLQASSTLGDGSAGSGEPCTTRNPEQTSEAKAEGDWWTYGTTEVVPFPILLSFELAGLERTCFRAADAVTGIENVDSGKILSICRSYVNGAKVKERGRI